MAGKELDLTRGNVTRMLLRLTVPLLGSTYLETLFSLVDAVWVGKCGTAALASVNLASFPIWIMFAVAAVVTTGVNSLVAQKLGEGTKDPKAREEGRQIASIGLMMAIIVGFAMTAVVVIWGRNLLSLMVGSNEAVAPIIDLSYSYLGFVFVFAPIHCLNEVITAILRAYGDTKTPLKVFAGGFVVNALLDPVFIFGWGPFPALGVVGAALATNVACISELIVLVYLLGRKRLAFEFPDVRPHFRRDYVMRVLSIGSPSSFASIVFSLVYMAISPAVGHFGPEALAALGIGHRIEGLNYSLCFALSLASITVIGQNIGAGRIDRARQAAQSALGMAVVANIAVSLSFALCSEWYASWFLSDPAALSIAAGYLRVLAISQVFAGMAMIIEGVFAGAGNTLPPMLVSIPCSLLRIPAAYWVVLRAGCAVTGLWWVICIMTVMRGSVMFLLYKLDLWVPRDKPMAPAQVAVGETA